MRQPEKIATGGAAMKIVNISEAKAQLSRLVDAAARGEPFIIAKSGKPLVKVMMIDPPAPTRLGFLEGKGQVPEDFDVMAADEISAAFAGETPSPDAEVEHRDHDLEATGADARGLQLLDKSDDEAT
jgi:prevent-host-death family protein